MEGTSPEPQLTAGDHLAILALVVQADDCATRRDAAAYAALFTEDAVMDGAKGSYQGRARIQQAVQAVWQAEASGTHHVTTGASLPPQPAGKLVVVTSTLLLLAQSPPALLGVVAVRQEVRRQGAAWLISRRTIG